MILALLARVPLKAWLGLAAIAVLAFILWHDHHLADRLKTVKAEKAAVIVQRDQLQATVQTMKADAALNKETSNDLAKRLKTIERNRRDNPIRGVFICPDLPGPASQSGATAGTDGTSAGSEHGTSAEDRGPALTEYGFDCENTAERLKSLQSWESNRAH